MSAPTDGDALFAAHRATVVAVAYQVLGTRADAEDVAQDTYLRWREVDPATVHDPRAYLATMATRTALNAVRSRARRREEYPGPWLPEPVVADDPLRRLLVREQLTYALSVLLQDVPPEQRAALVLRDVLELPYATVARALDRSEEAVRQLVHRARARVRAAAGGPPRPAEDAAVLEAFVAAVAAGDAQRLVGLLAPDVVLVSDGGGKVSAARRPVHGADDVARFVLGVAAGAEAGLRVELGTVNGGPGVLVHAGARLELTVALGVDVHGRVTGVYLVRNPDKLGSAAGAGGPSRS
ncbi:sigma-70 family RNA polymerase sigma factor [Cellulomonas sp. JZ18]|uniref:RNA polymerase sigma factor SigJ n=1 Tax=Cellulomonas sp. JZ18 TaxID=2654191 RepID=UPI0012D3F922|nr:RNA polymerase sigma factor SigJ [Cellulomonas sp. JZ18]QGQ19291.1 sigma-70 family RNA polymerase sigma factor [Cellulomonas sp. JZ18]